MRGRSLASIYSARARAKLRRRNHHGDAHSDAIFDSTEYAQVFWRDVTADFKEGTEFFRFSDGSIMIHTPPDTFRVARRVHEREYAWEMFDKQKGGE